MANVLITGGVGFLGSRLARELLTVGSLYVAGAPVPAPLRQVRRRRRLHGSLKTSGAQPMPGIRRNVMGRL